MFIDTGYHFTETMETLEKVRRRYGLNLRIMTVPHYQVPLWQSDPVNCCSTAKVFQLERALVGKVAWMSGVRRQESGTRREAAIVGRDRRGLVKVNPLANWSDLDVEGYIADHDVPVNPLVLKGYPSIGCWPRTRPVARVRMSGPAAGGPVQDASAVSRRVRTGRARADRRAPARRRLAGPAGPVPRSGDPHR